MISNTFYLYSIIESMRKLLNTKDYPREYKCAESIRSYVADIAEVTITEEEVLYLMIHLVRLG